MHEVADSGIGNERGSNSFLLKIVCELNAESESKAGDEPFAGEAASGDDDVETFVIAAGEEQLLYHTRYTVS